MAIKLKARDMAEAYLFSRAGFVITNNTYGKYVILIKIETNEVQWDYEEWPNRTMITAHKYIQDYFNQLNTGDVIDVEYILGLSENKKQSERITNPI
jgi:hypothetical protein